jgi:hypothetical protein
MMSGAYRLMLSGRLRLLWPLSDRAAGPIEGLQAATERETFGQRSVRGRETRAQQDQPNLSGGA